MTTPAIPHKTPSNSPSPKVWLTDTRIAWIASHLVFILMTLTLAYDYRTWEIILPYAGYFAFGFLVVTLALNPIIKIRPYLWMIKLNRYRRQLGVAAFSYASIHILCFLIKRVLDGKWQYLLHPGIIPVLFIGFPIFFILAITSNQYSIKKLSFKKWKSLHKKVYIAEAAIFIHLLLTGSKKLAIITFLPLVSLQLLRRFMEKRKETTP